MKKRLIALAVAGAFATPLAVQADDVTVDGFAEITYTLTDDSAKIKTGPLAGQNAAERKFGANGEVDFIANPADGVTARLDLDVNLALDGASDAIGGDSARIEQAFFAWNITDPVTLIGGVFNNPMSAEEEDVNEIRFITHSMVFKILDGQTALYGNNLAGVALAGGTDMVKGTLAYVNDIGGVNEENSVAVVINAMPMQDLDLEFGYVTQDNDTTAAGNVWNLNGTWTNIGGGGEVGFDYLAAAEIYDSAWNVWGGWDFGNGAVVRARYEAETFANNGPEPSAFTLYGAWDAASNLQIALEYTDRDADKGSGLDGKLVQVQFIAEIP